MKHVQVIDDALNCTYSIFAAEDDVFARLFPDGTDVEFSDDLYSRLGEGEASLLLAKIWEKPLEKKTVAGIHGTLFFGMPHKKKFYLTKLESEMKLVL
jgi:hypothetical protein